jgi:hypothetical protein
MQGVVAAVLETQRQARSIAVDAARSAADAAQTGAKSTAERTIVSLAAVAGIAVANATAVLSKADARGIAVGIAVLFVFLAAWAIFVEGPTMRAPLKSFASDLPTIGYLLPEADRAAILGMDALDGSQHRPPRPNPGTYRLYRGIHPHRGDRSLTVRAAAVTGWSDTGTIVFVTAVPSSGKSAVRRWIGDPRHITLIIWGVVFTVARLPKGTAVPWPSIELEEGVTRSHLPVLSGAQLADQLAVDRDRGEDLTGPVDLARRGA